MQAEMQEREIGVVTHYWSHLGVAGVHLTKPIDVGDHVHVVGHTSDLEQDVASIEVDHQSVQHADAGADIGIRVAEHVREHDRVLRAECGTDIGEAAISV